MRCDCLAGCYANRWPDAMRLRNYQSIKLIGAFVLAYEVFDLKNGDKIPVLKLFFKLGHWCQQRLFTKEPTDIQLIASIETINKLIELEFEAREKLN